MNATVNHLFSFTWFRISLVLTMMVLGAMLTAWLLKPILIPVILSFTLYSVLSPWMNSLSRHGLTRGQSALLLVLLLATLSSIAITFFIPKLIDQLTDFTSKISSFKQTLESMAGQLDQWLERIGIHQFNAENIMEAAISYTQGKSDSANLDAIIAGSNIMLEITATLILVPLFTFFLLKDFQSFRNNMLGLLPNRFFELGWLIYYRVTNRLQEYIRGLVMQITIMATFTSVGYAIFGFESPVLLGVLAGLFALIPYLGSALAIIPPVMIALGSVPFDPIMLGAAVGVIVAAHLFDNTVVVPTVIAHAVNLHPFVVIISVIIFGNFFGAMGMVLAIPIIAATNIIFIGLLRGLKYQVTP